MIGDLVSFHEIEDVAETVIIDVEVDVFHVGPPAIWHDVIEDLLGFFFFEALVFAKWREFGQVVIDFNPSSCAKFTDGRFAQMEENVMAHVPFFEFLERHRGTHVP